MIISEDNILQAELNNLTRSPLACAYPLHLIIKNIKKPWFVNLSRKGTPQTETNILPIVTPSSYIGKLFTATIDENRHTIANDTTLNSIWPSKPLLVYTKSSSIHNHFVPLHKHMVPHAGFLTLLPIQTHMNRQRHTHSDIPRIATLFSPPSYQTHPTNLVTADNIMEHQDMIWRSNYYPTIVRLTNALTLMLVI